MTFLLAILCTASSHVLHPVVGEKAPEISMPNAQGDILKLSDLKGKLVLIDFWASWCRSCRVDNQVLKRMITRYEQRSFKTGEGFDIYSVSLDTDKQVWMQAIANDKLNWDNHVCDFKKWDSLVVKSYNFKYLPHNLLIDGNGVVLAKNLYKEKLKAFLESQLTD
ncbi:MAG: TlpA family protein disulfide reductase [Bacteroidia bacterium]